MQIFSDQVVSGAELGLDWGLSDLLYAQIGGREVVYALSRTDEKLIELEISAGGELSVIGELTLSGPFEVGSTPALDLIEGNLAISGLSSSAGQFVSLEEDGSLGVQFSNTDVAEVSATSAVGEVLVSGNSDGDGLISFRDVGGSLTWAASLDDDASTYFGQVSATAKITIAGENFFAAVSGSENGVTLVQVETNGAMSPGASFGTLDGLPISQATDIKAIERLSENVLVVAGAGSSSLSTLRVDENAEIWLSDHILDSSETRFQAVTTIDTIVVGDFAYVAAGGADGGVSLFTMLPGGRMVHLSTFNDTQDTSLYRTSAISMSQANGSLQILGGSAWEAGLTRLVYDIGMQGSVLLASGGTLAGTQLNDQIIGSNMSDSITGSAGDDILFDGHGQDSLTGGDGADLFVFALDGVEDSILDFESGVDRIDLSGFDFLYDVSQLSITSLTDGAVVTFGAETLRIFSEDGGSLAEADFSNANILNVDRPPMLTVSQSLEGSGGADVLNGNSGNDTISGFGGDDALSGGGGDDHIFGGEGSDTLDGGLGRDVIDGGAGADLIIGSSDGDLIDGGAGGDTIYGDEIA